MVSRFQSIIFWFAVRKVWEPLVYWYVGIPHVGNGLNNYTSQFRSSRLNNRILNWLSFAETSSEFGNSDLVSAPVFGGNQTTFLVRRDAKSGDRVIVFSPNSQQQQQQMVSTNNNSVAATARSDEIAGLLWTFLFKKHLALFCISMQHLKYRRTSIYASDRDLKIRLT